VSHQLLAFDQASCFPALFIGAWELKVLANLSNEMSEFHLGLNQL
jgi:hypothetical protein